MLYYIISKGTNLAVWDLMIYAHQRSEACIKSVPKESNLPLGSESQWFTLIYKWFIACIPSLNISKLSNLALETRPLGHACYCNLQNEWESLRRSSNNKLVQNSSWTPLKITIYFASCSSNLSLTAVYAVYAVYCGLLYLCMHF